MPELNSHNSWKQVCNIFLVETKNKTQISRKFAGISRKFAGISRKFADICFNHFKTNISGMCGHGPRISRSRLSIFYLFPQNQFSKSMAPRLKRERRCGCRNLAKPFIAFFWFYRNFCFPSRFFKPRWSIAFFSCTRVSQDGVLCTFWLPNVLRATTACTFSSLIWPAGSAPAALASLLFDPPEPQIIGKTQCFATFLPFRTAASSFFWLFLFWSSFF